MQFDPYIYPKQIYYTQYDESDLHFIQHLYKKENINFHFQHNKNDHTIIFKNDTNIFPRLNPLNYQQNNDLSTDHKIIRTFDVRLETRNTEVT